jgi:peptide chain release factor 2
VGKEIQLSQLEKDIEHPEFWNNSTGAQRVMKAVSSLRDEVESWNLLKQRLHDLTELAQLDDESLRGELETEIAKLKPIVATFLCHDVLRRLRS